MQYGGLWPRVWASVIDGVVMTPLVALLVLIPFLPGALALPLLAFSAAGALSYEISLNAVLGGTVGKRALGLRVVDVQGESISWGRALLRSAPRIVFVLIHLELLLVPAPHPYGAPFTRYPWLTLTRVGWLSSLYTSAAIWSLADVATVLVNRRRRALHDFLAGTVVVRHVTAPAQGSEQFQIEGRFKSPPLAPSDTWFIERDRPLTVLGPGRAFPCPECRSQVNFGASECRSCGEPFHYEGEDAYRTEE